MTDSNETPAGENAETNTEAPILGKFKDHAALEAAYTALEAKLGTQTAEEGSAPPAAGLQALMAEANEALRGGGGTEEVWADIQAKAAQQGIAPEALGVYKRGLEAQMKDQEAQLYGAAGGEEKFKAAMEWGSENLSEEQRAEFDAAVASQDPLKTELAIRRLSSAYEAANPAVRHKVVGRSGPAPQTQGFAHRGEMEEAMANPRYLSDLKYALEVQQRAAMTDF